MGNARRSLTPVGLGLVCAALMCATAAGAGLGRTWLVSHATQTPATEVTPAPPPVAVLEAETPEAHVLEPTADTPPAIGPQVNLALLVIDSFDAPQPSLQAVWIVALHTELKTAYLLGLSPYLWVKAPDGGESRLRDAFAFDPATGSGGPAFAAGLAGTSYEPPLGTVTVDELLLSEMVNGLGGVDLGGAHMDGAGAVAYTLFAVPGDPLAQSDRQTELAGAMRDAAAVSMMDVTPYLDLVLKRGRTSLSPDTLRALAAAFQGYNPANIAIAPPVADPQLIVPGPDGLPAVMLSEDYLLSSQTAAAGQ